MNPVFLLILSTAGLFIGLYLAWSLHASQHIQVKLTHSPQLKTNKPPLISVIIPARNEARNISRCLQALLAQDYPNYEIIVIDDRSTDATPQILAGFAERAASIGKIPLKVLHGQELMLGWAGKPHALYQAARAAQGEWLCFIDADTFAEPELLNLTLASALGHKADMFTILTAQELGSFWEKVIMPLVFTALSFGFPPDRVNDPTKPDAIANGQFILIKHAVYRAFNGHSAVKDRIDEDRALAEIVKRQGYRLVIADGHQAATTRMYTCLREIWEGWTKNIYLGLREKLGLLSFGVLIGLIAALLLPLWLFAGLIWFVSSGGWLAGVITLQATVLWAYLLYLRLQACHFYQIFPFYVLTLPLGALVFTAMMCASTWMVLSGQGVTWKGRTYSD